MDTAMNGQDLFEAVRHKVAIQAEARANTGTSGNATKPTLKEICLLFNEQEPQGEKK